MRNANCELRNRLRPVSRARLRAVHSAICNSQSAFTLIEMLVVLGIIALVTALSLPMIVPIMRTRTLNSAVDTVKSACILARSTAIQQRKMMNLTFLQYTDATHGPGIVLTAYNLAGCVTANSDTLTDSNQTWPVNSFQYDQILMFPTGYPTWSSSSSYKIGNPVVDRGTLYVSISNNPSPSFEPPNSAYWQAIPTPQVRKIQKNDATTITIYEQGGQPYNPNDPNDPNEQDWYPQPVAGNVYVVMLSPGVPPAPYCIHNLANYGNNSTLASNDVRFLLLKTYSQYMGQTVQYLPTGCQFDFGSGYAGAVPWNSSTTYVPGNIVSDKGIVYQCINGNTNSEPSCTNPDYTHVPPTSTNSNWQIPDMTAWTYVFFPDGEAWTLSPPAQNLRDTTWFSTTYMAGGAVSGPKVLGPISPGLPAVQTSFGLLNCNTATIIVYATTGQVISQ